MGDEKTAGEGDAAMEQWRDGDTERAIKEGGRQGESNGEMEGKDKGGGLERWRDGDKETGLCRR